MKSLFKLLIFLPILGLIGCNEIEYLDAAAFVVKAEGMNEINSASWTSFLGVKDGKAYLETGSLIPLSGNPKVETFWTEFEDLPFAIREMIIYRRIPWIAREPYGND